MRVRKLYTERIRDKDSERMSDRVNTRLMVLGVNYMTTSKFCVYLKLQVFFNDLINYRKSPF